jgi:uncharacterized cupin superfamily protein
MSTLTDRLNGVSASMAVKVPCRVATTANITLSGTQTIDGIAVVAGDRVLVKDQTSSIDNGIYVAAASAWTRAKDFDGSRDVVSGTQVLIAEGSLHASTVWRTDIASGAVIGVDAMVFEQVTRSVNAADILLALGGDPLLKSGGTMTGFITAPGNPTNTWELAPKGYVDSLAQGLQIKTAVACASTGNLTLSGEQTIDGVLTSTSRVLVKSQSTASQNGIYVTAAGAWARATDLDVWTEVIGAYVYVSGGTVNGNSGWATQASAGGTIGSTSLVWVQFSAAGAYSGSGGITLTGSTFSLTPIADQRILGNVSGGSAAPIALTAAQIRTFLSISNVENKSATTILGELTALQIATALSYTPASVAALAATGGAALVGSTTGDTGAVLRTMAARVGEQYIVPEDFGATGVESDDQTTYINLWLTAIGAGAVGRLNPRDYRFTSALTLPLQNKRTIIGDNSYKSRLLYNGVSTNLDLLTLGDGSAETRGWVLRDFAIDSLVQMTGGYALRLKRTIFMDYDGVILTGQYDSTGVNATMKLYNGVYFEGFYYSTLKRSDIACRNVGISASGNGGYGAQLEIIGGTKIGGCGTGILIGGQAGGILIDDIDVIACVLDGLRVDTTLVATGNNQIFIGSKATFDSNGRDGIRLNDALAGFQYLQLDGTWSASNTGQGVNVINWGNGGSQAINITGAKLTNNSGNGFNNLSANNHITITAGSSITMSAMACSTAARAIPAFRPRRRCTQTPRATSTARSSACRRPSHRPSARSATVTATLSEGYYRYIGTTGTGARIAGHAKITVSAKGTHTTGLRFTLPVSTKTSATQIYPGRGFNPVNGKHLAPLCAGTNCDTTDFTNASPVTADGDFFWVSFEYDIA